jgi:hypothetical protein
MQDGVQRGVCTISNPGRCEFFLAAAAQAESTEYVYLAYTFEQFLMLNQSTDKWMPLADVNLVNAAGNSSPLVIEALFVLQNGIGNLSQLAPGQCVMYVNQTGGERPLQPCTVIGIAAINQATVVSDQGFGILSASDGLTHNCPGATEGRLTICIVPR